VYCSSKNYPEAERKMAHNGARLVYLPMSANGIQSIFYDIISILHALLFADVLLVLGVSAGFVLPLVRLFTNRKIITSIDGLEWKRNKWSKAARWFLWASEWCAVKASHANIADNESIQDYTAMRYGKLSTIIEYGADHVQPVTPQPADYERYPFLTKAYAVKVCRIEPENNIHIVLEAFSGLPGHNLVFVGNWNASEYGRKLRRQYNNYSNIIMLDPIYNQHDIDMLRSNAVLYIHGHSAGGTNPSLVEAMHLQLPVMAWGVNYNRTTTEGAARYFKSAEELRHHIRDTRVKELKQLGAAMAEIAHRRYRWSVIAKKYLHLIQAVCKKDVPQELQPGLSRVLSQKELSSKGLSHLQSISLFFEKR
jgi:glycosyltransferase involved in cell wall biosynthesis